MPWPNQIERWRQYVLWECRDLAPDLILAIIKKESAGIPGLVASASCSPYPIPLSSGGSITFNHALGLMQIVPRTIASYNSSHPQDIVYYEDMKSKDERAARLQIRVGCAVFASAVRNLHLYDPSVFPGSTPGNATPNQLILALVAYRMGSAALSKRLDKLKQMGKPLTFEALANTFPNWGQNAQGEWINRPIHYAQTVWKTALNHGMEPGEPPPPWTPGPPDSEIAGFNPSILFLLAASYFLYKGLKGDFFKWPR